MERGEEAVDWKEALACVEGDRDLLAEMAAVFLEEGPGLLGAVRKALDRQDPQAVEQAAHALKSSVGNFGARRAREAAFDLEKIGRSGDLSQAEEAYLELDDSLQQLRPVLETMQKGEEIP